MLRLPRILAVGALALFLGAGAARADHHGHGQYSGHGHGNYSGHGHGHFSGNFVPAEPTACGSSCASSGPRFYVGVEGLYWSRSHPRNVTILQDDNLSPDPADFFTVFESDDFDLEYDPGFRITTGVQFDDCNGVVFIFTDVGDWETEDTVLPQVGFLRLPFDAQGIPGFDFVTGALVRSWSELHSGELMFTRACGHGITLLAGLRYVHEDENLEILSEDIFGAFGSYRTEAENHILALQIGAYGSFCVCERLTIDAVVKAAGGMNVARMHNTVAFDDPEIGAIVLRDDQDTREKVAFIGEVGVFATYRCGERLTIRGGYQALYLTGVALAAEQLDFSADFDTPSAIKVDGDILYHGASLGLMFTW